MSELHVGATLGGRFEVVRLAASGGIGTIFKGLDRSKGELVAIKVLKRAKPEHVQRFGREAELLAKLEGPGFVRFVASGVLPSGEPYLVTEWLTGEDLSTRLKRGPLAIDEAVSLLKRVATTLAVAHRRNIIHRDLKPSNLWLVEGDLARPKILDFGLARFMDSASVSITTTGTIVGTPSYMSPEQARGSERLDARSDVFSLGCVLFESLAGTAPFAGDRVMEVLAKIVFEDARPIRRARPDVSAELERLVAQMLSRDPAERFADAAAAAAALSSLRATSGAARKSSSPPRPPSLTNVEQKVLCVVIADAPHLDDDDSTLNDGLSDVLSHREVLRAVAERQGGRLELLANGCLIATFSAAGQVGDLALSAARVALTLRSMLPVFRIAVATGLAVVSERLSVGDAVQRAAQLLDAAAPGEIRLDEASAGFLESRCVIEAQLLVREREAPRAERLLLGKATRCVGRDWELSTLEAAFDECASGGGARVMLVTAAAGMGKSRVRFELMRRLSGRDVEVCVGVGDPLRAGAPLGLLAQALRSRFRLDELAEDGARRERLRTQLARDLAGSDVERVCEFLGELLGLGGPEESVLLRAARQDPLLMADQMSRAWQDWLAAVSAVRPVMLVFDDMHWGDQPTVTFVDAALQRLGENPVFVLALARPSVHESFPSLWVERGATQIQLRKLSRKACEQLALEVLDGDGTPERVRRLVEHAEGNAFYLEELIRSAAEGSENLPVSVLAMLQLRLAALPDELRFVLRAGSVFGGAFEEQAVGFLLAQADRGVLRRTLDELVRREWLTRVDDDASGRNIHAFRHDLVREAAYGILTDEDRVLGHRLAADWLINAGEKEAIVVAEHCDRARDARASTWYARAAEQAMESNDLDAAIRRGERGVSCGAEPATRAALRVLQSEAHNWRAEWSKAEACGKEAMELLTVGSAPWAHAVLQRTWAALSLGDAARAETLLDHYIEHVADDETNRTHILARANMSLMASALDRREKLEQVLARLETVRAATQDPIVSGTLRFAFGVYEANAGNLSKAAHSFGASAEEFERGGDVRRSGLSRLNRCYSLVALGQYTGAELELRELEQAARRRSLRTMEADAAKMRALALTLSGRHAEAIESVRKAATIFASPPTPMLMAEARILLARILVATGDARAAERELGELPAEARGSRVVELRAHAAYACALQALGRAEEAAQHGALAIRALEAVQLTDEWEAFARLIHAETLLAMGDFSAAHAALQRAKQRLFERAALIDEPALRESFLSRVPENARTLLLAANTGGES